jgi:hypothetical protein
MLLLYFICCLPVQQIPACVKLLHSYLILKLHIHGCNCLLLLQMFFIIWWLSGIFIFMTNYFFICIYIEARNTKIVILVMIKEGYQPP